MAAGRLRGSHNEQSVGAQCLLAPRRCGAAASELAGHRDVGNVLLDVLHALLDLLSQLLFGDTMIVVPSTKVGAVQVSFL